MGLRDFLQEVERRWPDQVLRIDEEIDPRYEITAIVVALERRGRSPVVWFDRVKGSRFPVVVNVGATRERLALALDCSPKGLQEAYLSRIERPIPPVEVETGPVKEVVHLGDEANVLDFPQIVHHQDDGGPYISFGMAVARDPDTGNYNASYNRLMMKGPRVTGIYMTPGRHLRNYYLKAAERGRPLEVAVLVGVPLEYTLGAMFHGPIQEDELSIMGALAGRPVPVVRCETLDLLVLADAEIVIEGQVPPGVQEMEGPFGEFTGYASGARMREVFQVKAITHRRDAVFQDMAPGYREMFQISFPHEACLYRTLGGLVPALKALHRAAPLVLFMSISQRHEGQGKNALFAALAAEFYNKVVVVVDDDVDVRDYRQVMWAVATRAQPDRDIFIVPNALGAGLDPSCTREGITAKIGIDATAKPSLGEYAPRNRVPQEVMERIERSAILGP